MKISHRGNIQIDVAIKDIFDFFFSGFDELTCYCGESVIYPPVPCGTQPPECKKTCTRPHDCDHPGKLSHSVLIGVFLGFVICLGFLIAWFCCVVGLFFF